MKLLTFAHRAESQAFLKNKALSFKAKPFAFEGPIRKKRAIEGIKEMEKKL